MTTGILIVTHAKDADFLRYALKSIEKYATGFAGVMVIVPEHEVHKFDFVRGPDIVLKGYAEAPGRGFLHHMSQIMHADLRCPHWSAFLHMDADCMLWEQVSPADYFKDGRPILFRERYNMIRNQMRMHWLDAVIAATGIVPEFETMVRHPSVHLREVYGAARKAIEDHTGRQTEEYILSCKNSFPQSFAEFPTLGAVAIKEFGDRYHFVDYSVDTLDGCYVPERGRDKMVAFWSHHGIGHYRNQCEAILRGEQQAFLR